MLYKIVYICSSVTNVSLRNNTYTPFSKKSSKPHILFDLEICNFFMLIHITINSILFSIYNDPIALLFP
ncbi:hypothetical protein CN419_10205 [Bacillus cereus]|uniref:Uncharacterized protein n=2 Tax=Bacillus cereus group TaxID=86661 RepID=A0A9X6BHZ1_BACCE|nr:hypothetical protein CJ306_23025 [Bacillus cereus]AZR79110.1 hypothetical protein BtSCAC15_23410 [Bacillus thuringiensis]OTY29390.1 hypothetical protein BK738_09730 [Bacillus thuringiensis serovar rongseni]OTY72341.1 hypothetical protein BK753_07675 [Bacillus thuringiensis serovar canadensis]OTZ32007.1 hypothetical protein BK761_20015 [Bacillus thuringiensis serovar darmstadiensis]OUA62736.1 hypothetical protein BK785_04420 [Bacillus thuringiensis serovar bolivia]OUA79543.1 hypothetical pr